MLAPPSHVRLVHSVHEDKNDINTLLLGFTSVFKASYTLIERITLKKVCL